MATLPYSVSFLADSPSHPLLFICMNMLWILASSLSLYFLVCRFPPCRSMLIGWRFRNSARSGRASFFLNVELKCLKRARWRCYSQSKACPWHTSSKCLWCPHAFSGFVPQHCDGHLLGLGEHMFPQRSISKMKNIMSVQLNMQKTNTFLTSSKDILSFLKFNNLISWLFENFSERHWQLLKDFLNGYNKFKRNSTVLQAF